MNNKKAKATLIASLLCATACSEQASSIASGAKDAASGAGEIVGVYQDAGGSQVLLIQSGVADSEQLLVDIHVVVGEATQNGASLSVLIVDGPNANTSNQLSLPNGGDLSLRGKNDSARSQERSDNLIAVMSVIEQALPAPSIEAEPADLFGALKLGVEIARSTKAPGPLTVSLITGGGIHRTTEFDLLAEYEAGTASSTVAGSTSLSIPQPQPDNKEILTIRVLGAGRLTGLDPAPSTSLTTFLREEWIEWCNLQADIVDSCEVNGLKIGEAS